MTRILFILFALTALGACDGNAPPAFDAGTDGDADGDGDGDADADGDGDSDADTDVCVGNGHDEDGDGIDDNCDNCPSYANPGQADDNGDGIGNACEAPWNHDLLSEIAVFDPGLDDIASWASFGGTWQYGDDVIRGVSTPYGGNYLRSPYLPDDVYSVEATFQYDQASPAGDSYAGVVFASRQEGNASVWYTCLFQRDNNRLSIWRNSGQTISSLGSATVTAPAPDGQWHKVRVFYNGSTLRCTFADEAGGSGEVDISGSDIWSSMAGNAGLRVYNERAVYTSFVIYQ